mgnify:CR=1 FL=1
MKILLDRSYNSKTRFYEYELLASSEDKYTGYAKMISSYHRPLYMVKYQDVEVCRLEDDNLLRPWLGLLSLVFPGLRVKYTLKMEGLKENSILSYNGNSYSIKIDSSCYAIKGHSGCIVTIWENGGQVALIKRGKSVLGNGFETVEVLYDKHIPKQLIVLFSMFGWEIFVGRINGNRTIASISFSNPTVNINWRPSE